MNGLFTAPITGYTTSVTGDATFTVDGNLDLGSPGAGLLWFATASGNGRGTLSVTFGAANPDKPVTGAHLTLLALGLGFSDYPDEITVKDSDGNQLWSETALHDDGIHGDLRWDLSLTSDQYAALAAGGTMKIDFGVYSDNSFITAVLLDLHTADYGVEKPSAPPLRLRQRSDGVR